MIGYTPISVEEFGNQNYIGASKKVVADKIMIDSGIRYESHLDGTRTTHPADDDNCNIEYLIATHSHLDHLARFPREAALHKNAKIIMSRREAEASAVMLEDSFQINTKQWEAAYRKRHSVPPTIFNENELDAFLNAKKTLVDGAEWFTRPDGWQFGFHPANHTPGALSVFIITPDGRPIMDTGDTSNLNLLNDHPGLLEPDKQFLAKYDFLNRMRKPGSILITEGTNAGRKQTMSRDDTYRALVQEVKETQRLGGTTLLPAYVNQRLPLDARILTSADIPIHIDGKGRDLAQIQIPNIEELKRKGLIVFIEEGRVEADFHREAILNGSDPCGHEHPVILAGAADMGQGVSVYYGLRLLPGTPGQPNHNKVIFTGHLFEGSNAEALVKKIKKGETITLRNNQQDHIVNVRCEVKHLDNSAHIYQDGLIDLLRYYRPANVLIDHCPSPQDFATFVEAATAPDGLPSDYRPNFQHLTYKRRISI